MFTVISAKSSVKASTASSTAVGNIDEDTVALLDWLDCQKLSSYLPLLMQANITFAEVREGVTEEQWKKIGITLGIHRKILALASLQLTKGKRPMQHPTEATG
jgi:hypothetical protein